MAAQPDPGPDLVSGAARSFFDVPLAPDLGELDADVAFLGVPFDAGTPQPGNRTGQRAGPAAVRLSSWEMFEYAGATGAGAVGWYDIEAGREYLAGVTMCDVGDVVIQGADEAGNFARMTEAARRIVERGALLVAVGGDHSISFPLGRGVAANSQDIDVVHIDAHADFLDQLGSSRSTGASQLRRLAELPEVRNVTALGLRNVDLAEVEGMRELGARWATTLELVERGTGVVADLVTGDRPLYVSIDLDVLDLPLVPGTTLPEPGGLNYRELRSILAAIARQGRVVGFDIAELNPPYDPSAATARLAAWIVTHFLCEIFDDGARK